MESSVKYHIERAKSGRAACKKCKSKIGKGELRIGETRKKPGTDFDMVTWKKTGCFTMGRKLTASTNPPLTIETFLETVLDDPDGVMDDSDVFTKVKEDLEDAADSKKGGKKRAPEGESGGAIGIMGVAKDLYARAKEAAAAEGKPKKKRKKMDDDDDDGGDDGDAVRDALVAEMEALSESDREFVTLYAFYNDMTGDGLKSILRWNGQMLAGTKNILVERCIDGNINGRLGTCPTCGQGQVKLKDTGKEVYCNGFYDEDIGARISCFYTDSVENAPRENPWFTEEPSEEVKEEMKSKKKDPNRTKKENAVEESNAAVENLQFDLKSKAGIKAAASELLKVCREQNVDLPSEERKALTKVGQLILQNKDKNEKELFKIMVDEFGLKKSTKDVEKVKKVASDGCTVSANGSLFLAFKELGDLYFKGGNNNAGNTYRKVSEVIRKFEFEVTEENAKGLGKGKTKVAGVGKGSADKMYEFASTGTIAKLDEKRIAHE